MQPKIVAWKILDGCKVEELGDRVNELISEGWQPFGPAQYGESQGDEGLTLAYVVTMVKYEQQ